MTIGVGGSSPEEELRKLTSKRDSVAPIGQDERRQRVARAQALMREQGISALYLDASTSTFYFTGLRFHGSERMHGVVIPAEGEPVHISPAFEEAKLRALIEDAGAGPATVRCWQENEDPAALVIDILDGMGLAGGTLAIDPMTPFFRADALRRAGNSYDFVNGATITDACRRIKSANEIAIIRTAMNLTLDVQRATARILREGMTTTEVAAFLTEAHLALGFDGAPAFRIVLFGEPTAYPHGVPYPQTLKSGDMVLVDVGGAFHGYNSDLTRSYVFGEPNARQREIWSIAKRATQAAFDAAKLGAPCEAVDRAARRTIEAAGLGPGYATPGLPHRTGHGLGLDVHEEPYIVEGNATRLEAGMCFSNEPMICVYGEFGVRLEDHIYMADDGAHWFTEPSPSIDDPFGQGTQ
ncbi:Xaa-Pro peptidase family protein [Mesorhizobium sp. 8]|uniref:M24 family metallopeptidase n=1 Tax=Mesorhizobium sp. 8 TaxID=2584466 RepID=UPI001122784E|nr:Xaa-Pro peptidase family protein [Mesorhizobium sp. 8]QDC01341.1 aminopeptidase P family protein [Mesorhizobium sp. 8]